MSLKGLGNIHPEQFEAILVALKKRFDIVTLQDFFGGAAGEGAGQRPCIAITFDDGSKSYAAEAVPVMESLDIPSVCFLITSCIGDESIYWRYLYNYCINIGQGNTLADIINKEYQSAVSEAEIISFTRRHFDRGKTRRIVNTVFRHIVSEDEYRRTEAPLFLTEDDIALLKKSPLVTFGVHTETHPVMSKLSDRELADEISGSMDFYRKNIHDGIPMFSIPFGRLYKDYDERTVNIARRFSVEYIFSAYGGLNGREQATWNIRRIPVAGEMLSGGIDAFVNSLEHADVTDEYKTYEQRLHHAVSSLSL